MKTNKEYGSDFHYISDQEYRRDSKTDFFDSEVQFYFSGRVALKAILSESIKNQSLKKIYVPSYYCHEVYEFIKDLNIIIEYYDCDPIKNELPNDIKDINSHGLLIVNYFGLSSPSFEGYKNLIIIEDLTHNLELISDSKADYVFGSLRKVLPVPVGGFVKSKKAMPQLEEITFAEEVALEKLTGMVLKKKYLDGSFKEKQVFRELLINAETSFENNHTFTSLPSLIEKYFFELETEKIISVKKKNSFLAKENLIVNSNFSLLTNNFNTEFALILKFESNEHRDELKSYLISKQIYPMVLWPNQIYENDILLEKTILFVHIDFRYSSDDILHITNTINYFYNGA